MKFSNRLSLSAKNNSLNCFLNAETLTGSNPIFAYKNKNEITAMVISLLLSVGYEKDVFSFLQAGVELSLFTRQFKRILFYLLSSVDTKCFHLDMGIRIVKIFHFQFLFYTFLIFRSGLNLKTGGPQIRITTGLITKHHCCSNLWGPNFNGVFIFIQ